LLAQHLFVGIFEILQFACQIQMKHIPLRYLFYLKLEKIDPTDFDHLTFLLVVFC
jgi:hypothetical protein